MNLSVEHPAPAVAIDRLIARHGGLRVLYAVAVALIRPRRRPARRRADDLSDWVRRDVGLPPVPESPKYWNLGR